MHRPVGDAPRQDLSQEQGFHGNTESAEELYIGQPDCSWRVVADRLLADPRFSDMVSTQRRKLRRFTPEPSIIH